MNKRSFLFIISFLHTLLLSAQDHTEQQQPSAGCFFNLGIGYTQPTFLDQQFSILKYAGQAAAITGGFRFYKPTHLHHLDLHFDYGLLSNNANGGQVDYFRFEGSYAYKQHISSFASGKIRWYMGGSINGWWTLWRFQSYVNNAFNNSFYTSLSPNTSFIYQFNLFNRAFSAEASFFIPVVTFAMRPSYGSSSFSGFLDTEREDTFRQLMESSQVVSFNRFFRYNNAFSLEYLLRNDNRLRLTYEWDYQRYNEPRLVQTAAHTITIATMFNF